MIRPVKRSTVYLDPLVHKALRMKSAETSRSMSDLVNAAVKESLGEDAEDLAAFRERAREPLVGYQQMLARLRADGRI
jgi:hypothetical protein